MQCKTQSLIVIGGGEDPTFTVQAILGAYQIQQRKHKQILVSMEFY